MAEKTRLDTLLVQHGLAESRERARALIMAGKVLVDDTPVTKAGTKIAPGAQLRLKDGGPRPYVSRGGEKLGGALDFFRISPAGMKALDAGASTGGFTDCLLQRGAESVCCVDVGYGQLALSLRNDPRVTVMERTNIRHATPPDFPFPFDISVIDVSFISLLKVLPAVAPLLGPDAPVVALVKPQFEAGREGVGKGGVVRDPAVHIRVLESIFEGAPGAGLYPRSATHSPITGPKGNIEFFVLLKKTPSSEGISPAAATVETAWSALKSG